jgi:hypothetical protein
MFQPRLQKREAASQDEANRFRPIFTLRSRGGLVLLHPSLAQRACFASPFACAAGWYCFTLRLRGGLELLHPSLVWRAGIASPSRLREGRRQCGAGEGKCQ